MKHCFLLILGVFYLNIVAQTNIKGKIIDAKTGEPLVFANVMINQNYGVVSDFEGFFNLTIPLNKSDFFVSFIGYEKQHITLDVQKTYYLIELKPVAEALDEVVIVGKYVNPAIDLVKRVIKQKKQNDYRKRIPEYRFTKYYKFLVSGDTTAIKSPFDTIMKNGKLVKIDSSLYKFKKELRQKDFFLMENIGKINVKNGKEKVKVVANRTAGLKNPMYELLAMQNASYNVYDDELTFLFKKILGPLTRFSLKQYKYEIEDTLQLQERLVIVLAYKHTKKPLISGRIFIDQESLAIAKMTLNTYKEFELRTEHFFHYYAKYDMWFPTKSDLFIKKAEQKDGMRLAGGAIQIKSNSVKDSLAHSNKKSNFDYMYATSKTQILDVAFGSLYADKLTYDLQVDPKANKQPESFWQKYTGKKHTKRALNTYKYIDSIAEKEQIEKKIASVKALSTGYLNFKKIDIDLIDLLNFNLYEGVRLQLGGKTNQNLSDKYSVEAYGAYGFKDKDFKYAAKLNFKLWTQTQTFLHASYFKDLEKSAAFSNGIFDRKALLLDHISDDKFYMSKGFSVGISHLLSPKLQASLHFKHTDESAKHDIPFHYGRIDFQDKDLSAISIDAVYTPFAKYMLTPQGRKMIKDGYPKFSMHYEQNIPSFQLDKCRYFRFDFQSYFKKTYLNKNYSEAVMRVGFTPLQTPFTKLYMPNTNDFSSQSLLEHFTIGNNFAFETMKDMEFVDNALLSLHVQHTFADLKLGKKFKLDYRIIARMAYGFTFDDSRYNEVNSLDQVYMETGMEFRRLFANIGLGFYYRLGTYSHTKNIENLSVRMTLNPFKFL